MAAKRRTLTDEMGLFAPLPLAMAFDKDLTDKAFRLFCWLRSYSYLPGRSPGEFPPQEEIRQALGWGSKATVGQAIRNLKEREYLQIVRHQGADVEYKLLNGPTKITPGDTAIYVSLQASPSLENRDSENGSPSLENRDSEQNPPSLKSRDSLSLKSRVFSRAHGLKTFTDKKKEEEKERENAHADNALFLAAKPAYDVLAPYQLTAQPGPEQLKLLSEIVNLELWADVVKMWEGRRIVKLMKAVYDARLKASTGVKENNGKARFISASERNRNNRANAERFAEEIGRRRQLAEDELRRLGVENVAEVLSSQQSFPNQY